MKRVTPDGKKISSIRRIKGKKQSDVARRSGLSERTLRKVELADMAIPEATLINIASTLGTSTNEILKITDDPLSKVEFFPGTLGLMQMRLAPISSGNRLMSMAALSDSYDYELIVDPTTATAELLVDIMQMVHKKVEKDWEYNDGFSGHFSDIHRIGHANDILIKLSSQGISILANKYTRKKINEYEPGTYRLERHTTLHICIADNNTKEYVVYIEDDDVLPDREPKSRYNDLDDDIPF